MLAFFRRSRRESNQGFSLVELLVVVSILAILAAIAIPLFLNQKPKAFTASVQSDMRTAIMEMEALKPATNSGNSFAAGLQTNITKSGFRKSGMNSVTMYSDCKFDVGAGLIHSNGDYIVSAFTNTGSGSVASKTTAYIYDSASRTTESFVSGQASSTHWAAQWGAAPSICSEAAAY